jgi:hypothetical protein
VASKIRKQPALKRETPSEDVALVYGKSDDGAGVRILRKRDDRVELGEIRPLEHGKPLGGEVVQLRQRGDSPLFDVEVQVPAPPAAALARTTSGPAQVATDQYRENWDTIWSTSKNAKNKKLLN